MNTLYSIDRNQINLAEVYREANLFPILKEISNQEKQNESKCHFPHSNSGLPYLIPNFLPELSKSTSRNNQWVSFFQFHRTKVVCQHFRPSSTLTCDGERRCGVHTALQNFRKNAPEHRRRPSWEIFRRLDLTERERETTWCRPWEQWRL